MAGKIKTWVWVVVAIFAICVLGVVAIAGTGYYFFSKHFDTKVTSPANASLEFERTKAQFIGQKPLIELDEHGNFLHANTDRPAGTQRPQTLTILAFDSDDEKVVRVELPFWLLRLKGGGSRFDVGGGNVDLAKLRLTVEDLEKFGPTLILDQKDSNGSRVLIWSQ